MELFKSAYGGYIVLTSFLTDDFGTLYQLYNWLPQSPEDKGEGHVFYSENAF